MASAAPLSPDAHLVQDSGRDSEPEATPDTPRNATETHDGRAVWAAMLEVYGGASGGDHARVDAAIDAHATFWDTDEADLIRGLDQLQQARARRPHTDGNPFTIEAFDPVVSVHGDIAILRHRFTVLVAATSTRSSVRNSSVWRRDPAGWRLLHNHEDVLG